ncbi:hypothetical protein HBB16_14420 [Pseudonocardia sp. MCCB 268]|nr:hypothetical protein [Pseudonocardia cytotoxica]
MPVGPELAAVLADLISPVANGDMVELLYSAAAAAPYVDAHVNCQHGRGRAL